MQPKEKSKNSMKLLVTGAFGQAKNHIAELTGMGHEVFFMQQEAGELPVPAAQIEGIIGNGIFLSHPIEEFTSLRYIQLTSAGFDRVPMDFVRANGIEIYNARGVYSIPIAETVICGVLELYRGGASYVRQQDKKLWEKNRNLRELCGSTVGVVGCGSVGTECAKRFKAFGCEIIGIDVKPYESEHYDRMLGFENLDEILGVADITVVTAPLTDETYHMFDKRRIGLMKKGAILINVSRGALVCTKALEEALDAGLYGAVLDVFEEEPLDASSQLWTMPNVIITPHSSFIGGGNAQRLWQVIQSNLKKYS